MEILSLAEIVKVICGQIISGDRSAKIKGISTDSRTIKPGDLFLQSKGNVLTGISILRRQWIQAQWALLFQMNIR